MELWSFQFICKAKIVTDETEKELAIKLSNKAVSYEEP